MRLTTEPLERGFQSFRMVSRYNLQSYQVPPDSKNPILKSYCGKLLSEFKRYKWQSDPCRELIWSADLMTAHGYPLVYTIFGRGSNRTLILGGVHADELTPVHLAFKFAQHLHANPKAYDPDKVQVIIAPLVNPDGFLRRYPTRTNGFVDLNRNFLTADWYAKSLRYWSQRRKSRRRYFPGYFPNTEIETRFQQDLIKRFKPQKILSAHAPLGFLDYDGPEKLRAAKAFFDLRVARARARGFVREVSKKTKNYRIVDYSHYPGSLGNYAGKDQEIPTITLELETSHPSKVKQYWEKFLPGLIQSIEYRIN